MFLDQGYQSATFKDLSKLKAFENLTFSNADAEDFSTPKEGEKLLEELQEYVGLEYISEIYGKKYKAKECLMWEGIDSGSGRWHNDSTEGMDSSFLIYLDSAVIGIRSKGGKEEVINVKKYDYVWINQAPVFEHKAIDTGKPRRILGFEFYHL